jgi:hypothetical protein
MARYTCTKYYTLRIHVSKSFVIISIVGFAGFEKDQSMGSADLARSAK